ncbi:MAG: glycosyltransferase family 4 protein [Planctomycetes bacterium]|nr:glycosyltransferase family 4 protein [Planctomycetota bacterium]
MPTLLVLTDSLAPTDGVGQLARGYLRAWRELAPALSIDVRLARDAAPEDGALGAGVSIRRDLPRVAWSGERGLLARWFGGAAGARLRPFAFEAPRAILSWKEHPMTGIAMRWARQLRVPCASFAHGTYARRALEEGRTRRAALEEHAAARACFAVSQLVAEKLRAVAEVPHLEVLPNGIDLALFGASERGAAPPPCGTAPFVLTIAPAKERKGLELALRAWRRFARVEPAWHWVVVGAAFGAEPYGRALAEALAELPRVHRVERIEEATKRAWLRRARLHLFTPVEAADGAFEGFGLAYLEAAACGTASIGTTSCGAARHLSSELVSFCAPDEDAIAAELQRLALRAPAERARASARASRAVLAHDLRVGAARVLNVLGLLPAAEVPRR